MDNKSCILFQIPGPRWLNHWCPSLVLCNCVVMSLPLQVLFGTADGQVIVMDCHGRMLAHILLHESDGIVSMSWNYPSFLVEDSSESDTDSDDYTPPQGTLTILTQSTPQLHPLGPNPHTFTGTVHPPSQTWKIQIPSLQNPLFMLPFKIQ